MVWLCLTPFAPRSTFLQEERRDTQPGDIRAYLVKPELASGASLDQQQPATLRAFIFARGALGIRPAGLRELMGCCSCHAACSAARQALIFRRCLQVSGGAGLRTLSWEGARVVLCACIHTEDREDLVTSSGWNDR